jgi:hypothetical protein
MEFALVVPVIQIASTNHAIDSRASNGLHYLRWGGDSEAVQPEKG